VVRALGLAVVLVVALSLRLTTLDVPHFDSDEPAFEGLAASLRAGNGYTVRRMGVAVIDTGDALCLVRIEREAREHGGILDFYAPAHQDVVDDHALSVRPPLFPVVLATSVTLLGGVEVVAHPSGTRESTAEAIRDAVLHPRPAWRRAQLAVALPPLLASLVVCVLAFFVHRGSVLAATVAGLAVAVAPLDVWCAHRVTADTLTAALTGGAALLLARRGSLATVAIAGVLGGLSVLAKPSGVLLAPAYALAELAGERSWKRVSVFTGVLAATGLWWALLQLVLPGGSFVTALGYGGIGYTEEAARAAWPRFVHSRPLWIVPASTFVLSPLLGAGAIAVFFRARGEKGDKALAAFAALFLVMVVLWPAKENRYLLPAYVPFAAGLAWVTDRLLERARGGATRAAVFIFLLLLLVPSAWQARRWALSGAYEVTPLEPSYER
jgi:hypothetical protein